MSPRTWAELPRADELLTSRPTVRADTIDEAHETISQLFCEHHLAPIERSEVRMQLRSVHDGGVGIELLDYGRAVKIGVSRGLEDFHLVQIPLSGRAMMNVGNAVVESSPQVATVPPIDREFEMRWGNGVPTLIVYVSKDRLREMARAVYQVDSDRLQLGLHLQLGAPAGADFMRALVEHHDVLERATSDGAFARKLSADLLLVRLLNAADNSVSRSLGAWSNADSAAIPRGDVLVRRFEDAIEAAAVEGSSVLDIATELGVPLRTLQSHVRATRGTTPTAMLRDAQLRNARSLLSAADPQRETVTSVAMQSGFAHLGRFSTEYRRRFGESPAETLRR